MTSTLRTAPVARRQATRWAARILAALALPVVLVVGYQLWSSAIANPYFPPINQMITAFIDTWGGSGFTKHVVPSLTHFVVGFALGYVLGVVGGLVLGRIPWLNHMSSPLVGFAQTIPAVATLPLFLAVFGVGTQLQVGIIAFAVFTYVLVATTHAVAHIDPVTVDIVRVFRIPVSWKVFRVYLPAVSRSLLSSARVTLSLGLLVMVVSEMVGASRGIGASILIAQQDFAYDAMWAGMLLLALCGITINIVFSAIERRVFAHTGTAHHEGVAP